MNTSFLAVCAVVFLATCGVELLAYDSWMDAQAEAQVYSTSQAPAGGDDLRIGQARLRAELGFMSMNLEELGEFFKNNVSGQADRYVYQGWKLPSLFVSEKGGDCEDYVLFALAVLDHDRYDLRPVLGTYNGVGHAFLLVTEADGAVWLVDSMNFCVLEGGEMPSAYHAETYLDDMLNGGLL